MSVAASISKVAPIVGRALFASVRHELSRRNAGDLEALKISPVDARLDAAISVLTGDGDGLVGDMTLAVQGILSAKPAVFLEPSAVEWLRRAEVQTLVKNAAHHLLSGETRPADIEQARLLYQSIDPDSAWHGEVLFEHAVSFCTLTLLAPLSASDRVLLAGLNHRADGVARQMADLGVTMTGKLDAVADKVDVIAAHLAGRDPARPGFEGLTADVVDEYLLEAIRRVRTALIIQGPKAVDEYDELATRAFNGDLAAASLAVRLDALTHAAELLVRLDREDEAEVRLAQIRQLQIDAGVIVEARIAFARKQWDLGFNLLRERTEPAALGAFLDGIRRRDGREAALAYFRAGLAASDLTGASFFAVAMWARELEGLDAAVSLLTAASVEQVEQYPLLAVTRSRFRLAMAVVASRQDDVVSNIGHLPRPLEVRGDAENTPLLAAAIADLRGVQSQLARFRVPELEYLVHLNELYLESLIEHRAGRALVRLASLLAAPQTVVRYAPIAEIFDLPFDKRALRAQLDRAGMFGGYDDEQLRAAFSLVMADGDAREIASFVHEKRAELQGFLVRGDVVGIEAEALAKSGRLNEARALLASVPDLDPTARRLIEDVFAEVDGSDAIMVRIARYRDTNGDVDLENLVDLLAQSRDWERLADYAPALWGRRRQLIDAERAAAALGNSGRFAELDAFLGTLGDVVATSAVLSTEGAWSAIRAGDLRYARQCADMAVRLGGWDASRRQLEVNLRIEIGDWEGLAPLVRRDLIERHRRSPAELVQSAQIAATIGHRDAMALVEAAIEAAPDDPSTLLAGFELAMRSGIDNRPEVARWLARATSQSDRQSGPVMMAGLDQVRQMMAEGRDRSAKLNDLLMNAEIPLVHAARPLGTTLSSLIFDRMAENTALPLPQQRILLPFFSGNRLSSDLSGATHLSFDLTSILLLEFVGLLEDVLGNFEITLPAETLSALFDELMRSTSVQRSQAAQAARMTRLREAGNLLLIDETSASPADLVGADEDVRLLAGAAIAADGYIVHTSPLYEEGSDLERSWDPTPVIERLVSPLGIIRELAALGELTAFAEAEAKQLRHVAESGFEAEPPIDFARPLFIDGTALSYLDDAGVLPELVRLGVQLWVPPQVISHEKEQIEKYERMLLVRDGIEGVRSKLARALAEKRVKIGRKRPEPRGTERREPEPFRHAMADCADIDFFISDERMINRYLELTDQQKRTVPIATSLDVIDALVAKGAIEPARRLSARYRLRQAGAALVPVDLDELEAAARRSNWVRGASAELRAVRDSIHLPVLRQLLQLPSETPWLRMVSLNLAVAIERSWRDAKSLAEAQSSANYMFQILPDPDSLVDPTLYPEADAWAQEMWAVIVGFLASSLTMNAEQAKSYSDWFCEVVMPSIRQRGTGFLEIAARLPRSYLLNPPSLENDD